MKCKLCGNVISCKYDKKYKICMDCLNKPFEITSICRADIIGEGIKSGEFLDDGDMKKLANKMADSYCDSTFWIDMPIIVKHILENK